VNDSLQKEINFVKKIYKDIINEYSIFPLDKENKKIYIKHLTEVDLANIYEKYIDFLEKAKSMGLLEEDQKLKLLYDKNIWNENKEKRMSKIKEEIGYNTETKKKLIIGAQKKTIEDKIIDLEKELEDIQKERSEVLGITAEDYANRKSNEYLIYLSFCKNDKLENYFDSEDDFYNLEIEDLIKYGILYQKFITLFDLKNLKKTAVAGFFINMFFLSKDNPFTFFGKPLSKLTYNQVNLFTIARGYKYTLERSGESPPAFLNSLEDLVNWYETRSLPSTSEKDKENQNKEFLGKTYVGATKEELKRMVDPKDEVVDLVKEADKMGGNLSFDQILKIHGVK
jgi:hypothetical protein